VYTSGGSLTSGNGEVAQLGLRFVCSNCGSHGGERVGVADLVGASKGIWI